MSSATSVARRLPSEEAVRVEAVGTQILERVSWDQGTITHEPQVLGQAAHLWSRTSLRPADVDLALLYDGFTFNAVFNFSIKPLRMFLGRSTCVTSPVTITFDP